MTLGLHVRPFSCARYQMTHFETLEWLQAQIMTLLIHFTCVIREICVAVAMCSLAFPSPATCLAAYSCDTADLQANASDNLQCPTCIKVIIFYSSVA